MRSEYFPTFQCTKRIKVNLLIHSHTQKKLLNCSYAYIDHKTYTKSFKIVTCLHAQKPHCNFYGLVLTGTEQFLWGDSAGAEEIAVFLRVLNCSILAKLPHKNCLFLAKIPHKNCSIPVDIPYKNCFVLAEIPYKNCSVPVEIPSKKCSVPAWSWSWRLLRVTKSCCRLLQVTTGYFR